MYRRIYGQNKLGACLAAAVVTLAGATRLAKPAEAAELLTGCSATQMAYAQGYTDGSCKGRGGTVDYCEDNGNGGFSFGWTCIEPT
jgi:hypothetical protein